MDDRIAGQDPATAWPVFSVQDHVTPSYTRNASCWITVGTDLDLTCVSPWNSGHGRHWSGTVISPKHLIGAAHTGFGTAGTVFRFVTAAGAVVERTATGTPADLGFDIRIVTLDSALPGTIVPAQICPSDFVDKWHTPDEPEIPGLVVDQYERAIVVDLYSAVDANGFAWYHPQDATRLSFSPNQEAQFPLVAGDSGSPVFVVAGNVPILVSCAHWSFAGPHYGFHATAIRAVVQAGGEDVTYADLSGYPDM